MSIVIVHSGVTEQFGEFGGPEVEEEEEDNEDEDEEGRRSRLWVDRFSPHHYTELLSDDVSSSMAYLIYMIRSFLECMICRRTRILF